MEEFDTQFSVKGSNPLVVAKAFHGIEGWTFRADLNAPRVNGLMGTENCF